MWTALYVASIVAVNWMFTAIPPWPTPLGDLYLATLVVGFVFVLRDYAQREAGHAVLAATVAGGVLTWFIVEPAIAVASVTAFMLSEMVDWGVYSFLRRPLSQRILISSLISVPLDTLAFQYLAGYLTPAAFLTEIASKAVGVLLVWYLLHLRDRKLALAA